MQTLPYGFCVACETIHDADVCCNANTDKADEASYYVQMIIENHMEGELIDALKIIGTQLDKVINGVKNLYNELLKHRKENAMIEAFYEHASSTKPRYVTLAAAFDIIRLFQQKRSNADNLFARQKYEKLIRKN